MTVESENDMGAFLTVLAALLLDNVFRFEETVGRVTDMVMGSVRPDRELIVTLQGFDRLKQEFEAIGDALARYAELINTLLQNGMGRMNLEQTVIASITIGDLKDRLVSRLRNDDPKSEMAHLSGQGVAEVDVDVVF